RIAKVNLVTGTQDSSTSTAPLVALVVLLVVTAHVVMFHTRFGLRLRACGESPPGGGHRRRERAARAGRGRALRRAPRRPGRRVARVAAAPVRGPDVGRPRLHRAGGRDLARRPAVAPSVSSAPPRPRRTAADRGRRPRPGAHADAPLRPHHGRALRRHRPGAAARRPRHALRRGVRRAPRPGAALPLRDVVLGHAQQVGHGHRRPVGGLDRPAERPDRLHV
ncbi:MAG: hypothetical protein M0C28_07965, partial [Candidatus Moduliflexus flocculans]|nr:hypothetical protein [Candidatus Moduliflexus flocculans]